MELLNPDGLTHLQAGAICFLGFMVPYAFPPEDGEIRAIFPLEDADKSCTESSESSLAQETVQEVQGEDEVSSQTGPTTSSPDSANATELGADTERPDGEPPASSSSLNSCAYFSVISMLVLIILS